MDGFCLLYLFLILLMRSGDVETNPGPNTAVSTVSEMEFLMLAQHIPPSYYADVGISLGIPYAQLQAILIEKFKNYKNALMDVFMTWNVMQQPPHSNKRQLLADKLREIDLGGLSDRLLNEPPIPNSTGEPSRLLKSQTKPHLAESQTKPLPPELVERCANDFKFKYRSTVCKIRTDPLNPASTVQFKDMYTNLFLQEEHGTEKRKLDYDDIFHLKVNGEFSKRIMVQGEAGAGKSTLCAKIAWDWIEGRYFNHFVWVLIVPLHEFKQHTIGEIVKSYLAKSNPATVSQITEYIRSNPDKIFIAFDGLDEVRGKIMKTESHRSQPTDQMQPQPTQPSVTSSEECGSSSETGDIGLVDILCSDQLASCPVLVTTRPWRAVEIRSDGDLIKLYTFIRVEGFNRENLSVYIHKYFPKDEDLANKLIQFTSENDVISENMAHYPIYVAMLCFMWKELDKQKLKEMTVLKTFSQIFKEMIAFLKEHYAQKEVKKVGSPRSLITYLKQIDQLLEPIAKQALNGLLENTLVFCAADFEICPKSMDTACRVGILSQEDRITDSMRITIHQRNSHVQLPVFFPHKLFQEYMAGVHLASLYESDRNEFNRLIEQVVLPRKEEFRYLLYFTVSQNKSIATHVMSSILQRMHMNRAASQEQIDFIVDVAFESQDPDAAALVKNRVSSEEIELSIDMRTTSHTVAGYAFIGPHVVKLRIERDCGPTASLDVAEIICSIPSLKEASLLGAFHRCFFETLARKAKESKIAKLCIDCDLRGNDPTASRDLAKFLCLLPWLTDLTMRESDHLWLHDDFYHELALLASTSKNYFFTKKLQLDEKSEEFRQMDLGQQREYIRHLLHPTFAITPNLDVSSTSGISVKSDKIPEVQADIDTGIQEALNKGEAPWNRSRIMVIGPAGVGKTSLIRRLTGQEFNPEEKSTRGAEQNVVTKSAISSWELVTDTQTAKDVIIQSIAMDPNFGSNRPCSPGGEDNLSDPEITKRRGVELEHDQETSVNSVSEVAGRSESPGTTNVESPHTLEAPSTSSQPMIKGNVASTPEHRHIAESDIEELTESIRIRNRESGSNQSTLGEGNMSGATKTNVMEVAESNIQLLPTSNNKKIAKISQGITREEITKVKSSALDITYSMWDFGGQEIYYITHPLFLSWRSLYILVIPLHLELSDRAPREEDAENAQKQLKGSAVRTHRTILELVHFWLMSVYTHAVPDSQHEPKVLLIGTFAGDEGPGIIREKVKDKFQELKKQLGSKPYWKQVLFPMCGIDNRFSQGSEVNRIQDRIDGLIKDSAYMEVLMPIKWRTFLTEIEDSDRNTLTVKEAHSTMKTLGINDLKEVYAILKFYHDIGHLIYHEGCELIVLKPQFLNSIVSNIITVMDDKTMQEGLPWRDLMEKGILSIELIQAVWEEHKGDHDQLDDIINMMILFDLICEIPGRPDGRGFFVPCRSSPILDKKECHGKDDEVKFTIDFNHFLPDGFLHRFYVRMAKWSMERKKSIKPIFHCRQMVFYIDNRHRVVMTNQIQSKERHQIKVTIYAVTPAGASSGRTKVRVSLNENIIDHVHKTLEELKKRWARRIEYSVGILCPECAACNVQTLIPIQDILKCPEDSASCDELCSIYVGHILKAFNKDIGTTRTTAESQATGVSTLSEIDQESAEHYPRRTLPPSDCPQEHDGYTDTVHQFSQTHREGSSSRSRPYKRHAPSTQSRVLQDDPEIPEKQSKNQELLRNLESDRKLDKLSKHLPHGTYTTLCTYLGIGYNEAKQILRGVTNNYQEATRDCLAQWKTRTGGNMDELEKFLQDADAGDLVMYIK